MLFHYKVSLVFFFLILSHVTCSNLCRVDPEHSKLCTRLFLSIPDKSDIYSEHVRNRDTENFGSKFFQILAQTSKFWPNFWWIFRVSYDLTNKNKVFGNPENRGHKILDKVWSKALEIVVHVCREVSELKFNKLYSK